MQIAHLLDQFYFAVTRLTRLRRIGLDAHGKSCCVLRALLFTIITTTVNVIVFFQNTVRHLSQARQDFLLQFKNPTLNRKLYKGCQRIPYILKITQKFHSYRTHFCITVT